MYSSRQICFFFSSLLLLASGAYGQVQDHGPQSPPARTITKFLAAVHAGDRDSMREMLLIPPQSKDQAIIGQWIDMVATLGPNLHEDLLVPVTDSHMDEQFAVVRGGYANENYMELIKRGGHWKILPPSAPKKVFDFSGAELAQLETMEDWAHENWAPPGRDRSNGSAGTPVISRGQSEGAAARHATTEPDQVNSPPAVVVSRFLAALRARDGEGLRATLLPPEVSDKETFDGQVKALLHGNLKSMELTAPTEVKIDGQCAAVRGGFILQPYMLLVKRDGEWKISSPSGHVDLFALTADEQKRLISVEDYARARWLSAEERGLMTPQVFRRSAPQSTKSGTSSVDPDLPRPSPSPARRMDDEAVPITYNTGADWVAAPVFGKGTQRLFRLRRTHPRGHFPSTLLVRYTRAKSTQSVPELQKTLRNALRNSFSDQHVIESAGTTLGGQPAAFTVFTGSDGPFKIKGRGIMASGKGVLVQLIFTTDVPEYDRELPSFQHVLDSFEFKSAINNAEAPPGSSLDGGGQK